MYKTVQEMESSVPAVKSLNDKQKQVALHIMNACLEHGDDESAAIAKAIGHAKNLADAEFAVISTADQNDLPDSAFGWIEPGGTKDADGKTTPRSLRHLPYRNAQGGVDLPHVRNALARLNQVEGMPSEERAAVQAKLEHLLEKHRSTSTASFAEIHAFLLSNIEAGEHISDSELPLKEFEVLKCGEYYDPRYGKFQITPDILDALKKNFDERVFGQDVVVDENHDSAHKAQAWVKTLALKGKSLFAQFDKFTQDGLKNFKQGVYRYFSVEFAPVEKVVDGVKKSIPFVLKGIALTNRPVIKGMQPTFLSEGVQETEAEAEAARLLAEAKAKADEELNSKTSTTMDEVKLAEAVKTATAEKDLKLAEAQAKIDAYELAEKKAKTESFVNGLMLSEANPLNGFAAPSKDKLVAFAETLSEEQRVALSEILKEHKILEAGDFAEKGSGDDGAKDDEDDEDEDDEDDEEQKKLAAKADKMAAAYMKEDGKMSKTQALEKAQKELMGKKAAMSKK